MGGGGCGRAGGAGLTVLPQFRHKLVSGLVEERGHVVVQRVHVLHQPLVCLVVHLPHKQRDVLLV